MNQQDLRLIALVPTGLLLIPFVGNLTVAGWNWTWHDFLFAWVIFAFTTAFLRFLIVRAQGSLAYKAGAALAIGTGFCITWGTFAVQLIGEDNPGNVLYLLMILGGFIGVLVARFRAAGLAWVAFAMAAALALIPVVAVLRWPADFAPGYPKVQLLSAGFATLFIASGLCFRHAARTAKRDA